ncbi:glycosyl hydrolase [Paenibacillus timonensis]|uniref:Glycoside hydrolase family 76 protein n=1 Tax=Paenibacillus timonensis TaxID=225915 RepID=A0ABW3SAH3_9BACL|nr:glycoside hydrolase family 76 protein [Paenibacillus timonensis]MCH1639384.1 glycosyl hydrolase [Paenibacillus timonensis]
MKTTTRDTDVRRQRADLAQTALDEGFWNEEIQMYNIQMPCENGACNEIFHYWWMAHAVDVLVDGLRRTGDRLYARRLEELYDGLLRRNGGAWPNELYDDMEWMALAWLRAYQATGEPRYKEATLLLWQDIQTGWNEQVGGGIAWQKSQLDYKNTPANAPAVILAARLYQAFGHPDDWAWAQRIYEWQAANLVDPATGLVWDGMNRTGDGSIDKDWRFTYCQGVFIGASVEMYRVNGEKAFLEAALRTFRVVVQEFTSSETGLLPEEGDGDAGLFKGILIRYLVQLAQAVPDHREVAEYVGFQAERAWSRLAAPQQPRFGTDWSRGPAPEATVSLSSQLSGVMLMEAASGLTPDAAPEGETT